MQDLVCHVARRPDGVVVVRVPSVQPSNGERLPDAVFSFRIGDPQYSYWYAQCDLDAEGPVRREPESAVG